MRLGKFQREILNKIPDEGIQLSILYHTVTAFKRNAGERNGHFTWSVTKKAIDSLESKNLVRIENRNLTGAKIFKVSAIDKL